MSDIKKVFDKTVSLVQDTDANFKPSNALKLEMYALYKQATEGDISGKKPGITDPVGRAKYGAWEKIKGMASEQAMQNYIDRVEEYL